MVNYGPGVDPKNLVYDLRRILGEVSQWARQDIYITSGHRAGDMRCHAKGKAVDIRITTSQERYAIVRGLLLSGCNRIGLYSAHVHAAIPYKPPIHAPSSRYRDLPSILSPSQEP